MQGNWCLELKNPASILPDIHIKLSIHPIFMGFIRTEYSVQQTLIKMSYTSLHYNKTKYLNIIMQPDYRKGYFSVEILHLNYSYGFAKNSKLKAAWTDVALYRQKQKAYYFYTWKRVKYPFKRWKTWSVLVSVILYSLGLRLQLLLFQLRIQVP